MGVLLLIPGVCGVIDAALLTTLRSVIMMPGALTEVALTVYDIVESLENALGALFGFLMGGARESGRSLNQAASSRRGLSNDVLDALSPIKADLISVFDKRQNTMA
ncbi:hypothetical protein B0O99DRAFT_748795 [Bisporella sp. PMI_857]|nr:hypothetical protein B0O99DRAFT_748795 [Bisporella sp. PMI_857]